MGTDWKNLSLEVMRLKEKNLRLKEMAKLDSIIVWVLFALNGLHLFSSLISHQVLNLC